MTSNTQAMTYMTLGTGILFGVGVMCLPLVWPLGEAVDALGALTQVAGFTLGVGGAGTVSYAARHFGAKSPTSAELRRQARRQPVDRARVTDPG